MSESSGQGREVEIKLELDEATYQDILGRFPRAERPVSQRNTFYDSENRALLSGRWALRIREQEGRFLVTVKGKREGGADGLYDRVEREEEIPRSDARTLSDGFRLSEARVAPCELLRERFGDLRVEPFLSFVNHRTRIAFDSWTLELDRTRVGGRDLYELELETEPRTVEAGIRDLKRLFRNEGWAYRPSRESKMEKALRLGC